MRLSSTRRCCCITPRRKGKGVQVVGPTLKDEYYGIALPTGSPLRKPINEALLELMQDGAYTEIHDKWFEPS